MRKVTNQLDLQIITIITITLGSSTSKLYETVDPSVAHNNTVLDFIFIVCYTSISEYHTSFISVLSPAFNYSCQINRYCVKG